ncbi:ATPase [Namhaeicola litoreus]|uniref:ATPase n=1 Tax=Namhaeicola litoreus TaxID=1052145 RepID=A0ABW3Y183_9FLAO
MNLPVHILTVGAQTFQLAKLKENRLTYDFDQIWAYFECKGKLLFHENFTLHKTDKDLLLKLCAYFLNDHQLCKQFNIDPNKGILLTGPVGCGKTSFMKLLSTITPKKKTFDLIPARNITFEFSNQGFSVIEKYGNHKSYCFDDLGVEPNGRHFGAECNVMGEVLLSRYDLFVNHKVKTHATTNLNAQELENRYGNRVRSRMRAMFNLVGLDNLVKDKRI